MKILKNADILTMNDGPVLQRGDLWIAEGRIIKIAAEEENGPGGHSGGMGKTAWEGAEAVPPETEIFDCTGCTVMPGLIDAHCHFDQSYMADFFLASGVTSVRSLRGFEGHAGWRDEILAGTRRGPYIYSSGPVYDGEDPSIPHNDNVILYSREDVEAAIAFVKSQGFLWMKTYPMIEPELYRYLLRRCEEENLPVCGHMTKRMEHRYLADHGYTCCEHTSSLPADPEEIRYMAEAGMWFCPTHVVCETLPDYVWNGKQLRDLPHYEDLPECIRRKWEEDNAVIIENYRKWNVHPDFQMIIDRAKTFLRYSDKVMAGTDCPYPGIVPGFAMADELEKLVNVYGMSVYQALQAATVRPAEYIGIEKEKGRILPGMDADLVVLEGNPLDNIGNVRRVKQVFQGTRDWNRETLQSYLTAAGRLKKEESEVILGKDGQPLD